MAASTRVRTGFGWTRRLTSSSDETSAPSTSASTPTRATPVAFSGATRLPSEASSYSFTHLRTYVLTYLRTYELTYLRTYVLTYLRTYVLTYSPLRRDWTTAERSKLDAFATLPSTSVLEVRRLVKMTSPPAPYIYIYIYIYVCTGETSRQDAVATRTLHIRIHIHIRMYR